jgi:hypothetical protein
VRKTDRPSQFPGHVLHNANRRYREGVRIRTLVRGVKALSATLLVVALLQGAACSSSPQPGDQTAGSAGGGASSMTAAGDAGEPSSAGASVANGGRSGAGITDEAGSSPGGADTMSLAGASGAGGEAGGNPCAACTSGLCSASGACVDCLPSNDQCPDGQYCTSADTCAPGCKTGASCASGVCDANHDCQSCLSDQECSAPRVCGDNQCAPACGVDQEGSGAGCGTGLTCCSLHCVDASTDSEHCGACGTACAKGQFCGVAGCQDSTLAGVCSVAKVTVVLDGQLGNETPARAIAAALAAQCIPAPVVREVSQSEADAVNTSTGRPVAGGDELLVSAGGYYYAHLINYVTSGPVAPVYSIQNGDNLEFRLRATNALIVSNPAGGSHDATDAFVIQFMRDPSSGSLILNAQGFWQSGTSAAAYYFANAMLPTLSTRTEAWYAYQWTDANGDLAPELDEITLIAAGD